LVHLNSVAGPSPEAKYSSNVEGTTDWSDLSEHSCSDHPQVG